MKVSELRRDASCRQQLLWRCDVEGSLAIDRVDACLQRARFARIVCPDVLVQWRSEETDHAILYVPATGRVQLRIDGFTPKPDRAKEAQQVFAVFFEAVRHSSAEAA